MAAMVNLFKFDNTSRRFIDLKAYDSCPDELIAERIVSGESALFEVIMRRYNQRLFRIQRSYIQDEEAVKDTLQVTYIKAYEHLHTFRGDSRFSTWITRIAINEALKSLAREKRYTKLHVDDSYLTHNEYPIFHI